MQKAEADKTLTNMDSFCLEFNSPPEQKHKNAASLIVEEILDEIVDNASEKLAAKAKFHQKSYLRKSIVNDLIVFSPQMASHPAGKTSPLHTPHFDANDTFEHFPTPQVYPSNGHPNVSINLDEIINSYKKLSLDSPRRTGNEFTEKSHIDSTFVNSDFVDNDGSFQADTMDITCSNVTPTASKNKEANESTELNLRSILESGSSKKRANKKAFAASSFNLEVGDEIKIITKQHCDTPLMKNEENISVPNINVAEKDDSMASDIDSTFINSQSVANDSKSAENLQEVMDTTYQTEVNTTTVKEINLESGKEANKSLILADMDATCVKEPIVSKKLAEENIVAASLFSLEAGDEIKIITKERCDKSLIEKEEKTSERNIASTSLVNDSKTAENLEEVMDTTYQTEVNTTTVKEINVASAKEANKSLILADMDATCVKEPIVKKLTEENIVAVCPFSLEAADEIKIITKERCDKSLIEKEEKTSERNIASTFLVNDSKTGENLEKVKTTNVTEINVEGAGESNKSISSADKESIVEQPDEKDFALKITKPLMKNDENNSPELGNNGFDGTDFEIKSEELEKSLQLNVLSKDSEEEIVGDNLSDTLKPETLVEINAASANLQTVAEMNTSDDEFILSYDDVKDSLIDDKKFLKQADLKLKISELMQSNLKLKLLLLKYEQRDILSEKVGAKVESPLLAAYHEAEAKLSKTEEKNRDLEGKLVKLEMTVELLEKDKEMLIKDLKSFKQILSRMDEITEKGVQHRNQLKKTITKFELQEMNYKAKINYLSEKVYAYEKRGVTVNKENQRNLSNN